MTPQNNKYKKSLSVIDSQFILSQSDSSSDGGGETTRYDIDESGLDFYYKRENNDTYVIIVSEDSPFLDFFTEIYPERVPAEGINNNDSYIMSTLCDSGVMYTMSNMCLGYSHDQPEPQVLVCVNDNNHFFGGSISDSTGDYNHAVLKIKFVLPGSEFDLSGYTKENPKYVYLVKLPLPPYMGPI